MNAPKRDNYPPFKLLVALAMLFSCPIIVLMIFILRDTNREWTLERIEKRIGAEVPDNANHVQYEVAPDQKGIYLSFEVPLYQGDNFASHFCNDPLTSGYDPIQDRGKYQPLPPYEPTSPLVYGQYCVGYPASILRVDRRNLGVDQITLLMFFN